MVGDAAIGCDLPPHWERPFYALAPEVSDSEVDLKLSPYNSGIFG